MTKLWESGPIAMGSAASAWYGHTRSSPPNGPVHIGIKPSTPGSTLEVTNFRTTLNSAMTQYGYWILVKNNSGKAVSFTVIVADVD
jgi:hypothetical protein